MQMISFYQRNSIQKHSEDLSQSKSHFSNVQRDCPHQGAGGCPSLVVEQTFYTQKVPD